MPPIWRIDGCDRLNIHESKEEAGRYVWNLPHQNRVQFTRFWHRRDGLIECKCDYFREYDTHYRQFEWFVFDGKRCVESIQQSFEIMQEIPYFQKKYSEDELRNAYRPLEGNDHLHNLVETMFCRRRVNYSFGSTGDLVKAEEFKADGEPIEELLFQKLPDRPFEETTKELAAKTAVTILKAAKKRSPSKPYRGLAMIYSAEHAHCGLPHHVCLTGPKSIVAGRPIRLRELPRFVGRDV